MNLFHHKDVKAQGRIKTLLFFVPRGISSCFASKAFPSVTILLMFLCLCSSFSYAAETLTVAVASSLYPAIQQQAKAFEKEHDVTIRLVSGSTGRLYNQIMQGAPFDVFIAADELRPSLLAKQGRVVEQYHAGQGYLGVRIGKNNVADIGRLTDPSIHHIVIANPDVAPFGKASREILKQKGLWHVLKDKFVYAQNAMQASMMVNNGLVDAGFVPVESNKTAIAVIHYQGVALTARDVTSRWLDSIAMLQSEQLVLSAR